MGTSRHLLANREHGHRAHGESVVISPVSSPASSAPVEPGDQLVLDVTLGRGNGGIFKFAARGLVVIRSWPRLS